MHDEKLHKEIEIGVKALGNLTRIQILRFISRKERNVNEIAEEFSISLPACSSHLKILWEAGFINRRKEGNQIFYSLSIKNLEEFQEKVRDFILGK